MKFTIPSIGMACLDYLFIFKMVGLLSTVSFFLFTVTVIEMYIYYLSTICHDFLLIKLQNTQSSDRHIGFYVENQNY